MLLDILLCFCTHVNHGLLCFVDCFIGLSNEGVGKMYMFWLVGFFVSWHINICRLFNAKAILIEEQ